MPSPGGAFQLLATEVLPGSDCRLGSRPGKTVVITRSSERIDVLDQLSFCEDSIYEAHQRIDVLDQLFFCEED